MNDLMTQDDDESPREAKIPRDMAIIKMENDQIMAMAAARPRDYGRIKTELSALLNEFPILAEEAVYNAPVGQEKDKCRDCGNEQYPKKGAASQICMKCRSANIKPGEMKYARGLSIRAAETLRTACGFNRVSGDVEQLDDNRVKIYATFVDFQRGNVSADSTIISRLITKSDGSSYSQNEDRFLNTVVKAHKAKLIRGVVVSSLDAGLRAWFRDECEKKIAKALTPEVVKAIVGHFATLGVPIDRIEKHFGAESSAWTELHRKTLHGLAAGIKSGEITAAEAFPERDEFGGSNGNGNGNGHAGGTVSADDLTGASGADATKEPTKEAEEKTVSQPAEPGISKELFAIRDAILAAKAMPDVRKLYDRHVGPESTLDEAGRDMVSNWVSARDKEFQDAKDAKVKPKDLLGE